MEGGPIRVLLIAQVRVAQWLRSFWKASETSPCTIAHAPTLGVARQYLCNNPVDALLLDAGPDPSRAGALIPAACGLHPGVPLIVLADSDDASLAIESLRHGAQDFLAKGDLEPSALERALRYAIERNRLQSTLHTLSLIDDLTGLQNRRGFLALAEQHLKLIRRKGAALLVYLDLDDLKSINDTFGHPAGNSALVETADILRGCFRQSDILGRLGGDEFCVLMTDAGQHAADKLRKRIQQSVQRSNSSKRHRYTLSLSIGIADVPAGCTDVEELISSADAKMYQHKRNKLVRPVALGGASAVRA